MDEQGLPDVNQLSLDRTVLANERNYLSWVRTGLAFLAGGLAVARFMKEVMPLWALLITASLLILLSGLAFLVGSWRYHHLNLRIRHLDIDLTPSWWIHLASFVMIICSVLALISLFIGIV